MLRFVKAAWWAQMCLWLFSLLFCLFQRCQNYKGIGTRQRKLQAGVCSRGTNGNQVSAVTEAQGGSEMGLKLDGREKSTL